MSAKANPYPWEKTRIIPYENDKGTVIKFAHTNSDRGQATIPEGFVQNAQRVTLYVHSITYFQRCVIIE